MGVIVDTVLGEIVGTTLGEPEGIAVGIIVSRKEGDLVGIEGVLVGAEVGERSCTSIATISSTFISFA